ncbi:hypothetical protein CkaCkLH20_06062 [Colletotrichum karsti]|uniref:Uncharacterized protein n=1 Tax=Colletotrichum karsti TaxID=1095194 RepID=A0A9P6I608_9PEZI|nr:uncharacterized protein CkaCkLH20_06062 [Colletotrichum karsti]KAF9876654.1 hypothetical protein CkaCkLH20_06062 [Colletotrichum karsti]
MSNLGLADPLNSVPASPELNKAFNKFLQTNSITLIWRESHSPYQDIYAGIESDLLSEQTALLSPGGKAPDAAKRQQMRENLDQRAPLLYSWSEALTLSNGNTISIAGNLSSTSWFLSYAPGTPIFVYSRNYAREPGHEDNFHYGGYVPYPPDYALRRLKTLTVDILGQIVTLLAFDACNPAPMSDHYAGLLNLATESNADLVPFARDVWSNWKCRFEGKPSVYYVHALQKNAKAREWAFTLMRTPAAGNEEEGFRAALSLVARILTNTRNDERVNARLKELALAYVAEEGKRAKEWLFEEGSSDEDVLVYKKGIIDKSIHEHYAAYPGLWYYSTPFFLPPGSDLPRFYLRLVDNTPEQPEQDEQVPNEAADDDDDDDGGNDNDASLDVIVVNTRSPKKPPAIPTPNPSSSPPRLRHPRTLALRRSYRNRC